MTNRQIIYKILFTPLGGINCEDKKFTGKQIEMLVNLGGNSISFEDIRKELAYFVAEGMLTVKNTDTARVYSLYNNKIMQKEPKTKVKKEPTEMKVSASNLIKAIVDNKGKMTSVLFTKIDGTDRTVNGIFHNQTTLGNVMFKEAKYYRAKKAGTLTESDHEFTQMLPKSIKEVRVGGVRYLINKVTKK